MLQAATQNQGAIGAQTKLDVELRKVFKVFNGETAVRGVDLDIHRGEFFSILGPSGCGKTTTLRLIAGFEMPSAGEVLIRGQSVTQTPAYLRPVNTVFQSYALFNHLTVWENIAFGLRLKRKSKPEVEEKVREALTLVKMESFANRYPSQMSGGQQQRVALARALVNRPAVLLLDEPLGALDLKLRKQMQVELSNLHRNLGLTFIMVTHDQEEAMSLSDRIAVMHDGRIEQIGSPNEIYEYPQTPFVADFIGDTNLFRGTVESVDSARLFIVTETGLSMEIQQIEIPGVQLPQQDLRTGASAVVSVRPEKVTLSFYPVGGAVNCFEGRLLNSMYLGTHIQYVVQLLSGENVMVRQPKTGDSLPDSNTPVYVCWGTTDCLALPDQK
ncbi:ABC transporter ATP-binding protein [Planktothrix paucivesiculata]|uniref:Spermidine/putrescine import ATP-binding protein PotA n=1 Tax=Planktothrix paucivesiculata PCC 9631 TaxID=671071 RepID=A0A7Z9C4J0_9CYAN|nr:ABC transporter ATP-binding protein [Planktothrix paucivesiculata]VXD25690.1 Spermidine/putrescine import ATP-binding protein PotA [Planktothrix paucivesiculata PCC 9631]